MHIPAPAPILDLVQAVEGLSMAECCESEMAAQHHPELVAQLALGIQERGLDTPGAREALQQLRHQFVAHTKHEISKSPQLDGTDAADWLALPRSQRSAEQQAAVLRNVGQLTLKYGRDAQWMLMGNGTDEREVTTWRLVLQPGPLVLRAP